MSGYTPVFNTLLSGTLYGRWPHTGIWACLLSRATRDGTIDETPQSLAAAIGVDKEVLLSCIKDFMEPDEESRTPDNEGRRLTLIDPARSWGWKITNHATYREKARLMAKNAREVETGENAERLRVRRGPPMTADDRLSEAEANTNKKDGSTSSEVVRVFDHWKRVHNHPKSKLEDKRTKLIRSALKNYSADDLCIAIDGYKNSAWHMGGNPEKAVHDSIELILRDAKHIDAGIGFAESKANGNGNEAPRW